MDFDFNRLVDRQGTHSLKWELVPQDGNPMWVADMDFPTAPVVREAIEERAKHGIFGYSVIPDEWARAYQGWWEKRYGFSFHESHLMFVTGVVPAISSAIRRFTYPAEKILIQTPVYQAFYSCIRDNGREVLENELIYEDGAYRMDFIDLECKLADPLCTMMILCNPQNPTGNIWSKEDLSKVGALAAKHGVLVFSDEIHCDLTDPGSTYTPYASVSDECRMRSITAIAPTKTFNLAGISSAAVMVAEPGIRERMKRAIHLDGVGEPNAFAVDGAVAAYTQGGDWLDALREYLLLNKRTVQAFLSNNMPRIRLVESHATYLLWLDISEMEENDSEIFAKHLLEKTGLRLAGGYLYGESGRHFLRMNIACPREQVVDGLNRLKSYVGGIE